MKAFPRSGRFAVIALLGGFSATACDGGSPAPPGVPASNAAFGAPERVGYAAGDDWEPAVIADRAGHLYVAFAHAPVAREDRGVYHTRMLVQRSDDGGVHWDPPVAIAPPARKGSEGEFDPWFALAPNGRTLSLGFLQGYPHAPIDIVKSGDFGTTWSPPKSVSNLPPPLDKVVLVSRGPLAAVGYTDYHSHIVASISRDWGRSWSTHVIAKLHGLTGASQVLVSGGGIDSQRNVYFTWDATWPSGHRPAPAALWMTKSADLGLSWTAKTIGYSGLPRRCGQCQDKEFFAAQLTMAVGSGDVLYLLWNATPPGNLENGAPQRIYFSRSQDRGATFTPPLDVSNAVAGATHGFPALAVGAVPGDVRLAWMDTRSGRWNTFYRSSRDRGHSFSAVTQLSSGAAANFGVPYGDYMQLTVDPEGMTHAAWGQDTNQNNPGNIWIANQIR